MVTYTLYEKGNIMNIEIQDNFIQQKRYSMYPAAAYAVQGGFWICHFIVPVLYFYDVDKERITFCRNIPSKYTSEETFASGMCVIDNKIYIAPYYGKYIIMYDIENDVFEESVRVNADGVFRNVIWYEDTLYFFPGRCEELMKYNIKTQEIEKEKIPFSVEEKYICNVIRTKDLVVCSRYKSSEIWIYDLTKNSWESIKLTGNGWYNRMIVNGDKIYVHDYINDKVKCINISKGDFCAELKEDISSASPLGVYEGKMIINVETSGEWLICDEMLNVLERYSLQERFVPPRGWNYCMFTVKNNDGFIYYFDSCSVWTVDKDNSIVIKRMEFTPEQEEDIRRKTIGKKLIKENDFNGLEEFCQFIAEMKV